MTDRLMDDIATSDDDLPVSVEPMPDDDRGDGPVPS